MTKEPFTSKRCHNCGMHGQSVDLVNAAKRMQPRPFRPRRMQNVWGLRRCLTCHTYYDRDINGALNIADAARHLLDGFHRPQYLL
jgi:transposase